ncbi:MFS transporter [Plantactinospora soyae]|uniref:MFS family arabinose efflux permease n=1 Tax=Plantactinospora soyae TaxID=1544732 RepID=A0A927MCN2_9ACTN|nr:MFS transporter [Plantactinospora soyae]MBE1492288.1 putative MFS family arabinose efflux permease [Plantactinospora soyae]
MTTETNIGAPGSARLRGSAVLFMSTSAALATSTIYPLQPAIADVADSLGTQITAVGVALAFGPIGYMVGLGVLVPLVDRFAPGRVLAAQFGVLACALAASAVVPTVTLLGLMVAVVGACSSVGAGLSSVAGRLAPPRRRATILGVVTAGISAGILAGRIVGGWLSDELGWRKMLLVFAAACGLVTVCCLVALPRAHGTAERGYLSALRSLPGLFVRHATLRVAALRGSMWFFAFSVVWAGIAVALSEPPFSYSAERIGLYALAGLSGILATQVAGAWTDRVGARRVILAGLVLAAVAATILGFSLANTAVTLVCLAVFDAGLFAAQVANQSTVLAIDPAAPARFNSAYMLVYFVGGSLGTAFGAATAKWFGWLPTALIAGAAIGVAATITTFTRQRRWHRRRADRGISVAEDAVPHQSRA